jgi:D-threo-aldose 1-dehydrogenase
MSLGDLVEFGSTGLLVSPLCLGTSSWGPARVAETREEGEQRIGALADAFFAGALPTNYIDTSNEYGKALSELQIGAAIRRANGLGSALVLQTKLDRDVTTGDFSGDRMWRSLEESQKRLGLDRIPMMFLHDPENIGFEASMARGGPVEALVAMKERGHVEHIGISGGPVGMLQKFVETDIFEALVSHNRFTIVERSANDLFDAAVARNIGINNAAPYGGGVLTGDARFAGTYGYRPIHPAVQAAVDGVARLCAEAGVSMAAAALQFSLRDPRIHSTIVGISSLAAMDRTVAEAHEDIPEQLWNEIDALVPRGLTHDNGE